MTASDFRLTPQNLCMADAMPFQQHHEARVAGRDLNDVLTPKLLLNLRSNLRVGDEVVVCGYHDQTWQHLTQIARLRVTVSSVDGVEFMLDGEVREVPIPDTAPEVKEAGDVVEVARGLRCFNVIDKESGDVLETFKTKREAEDCAAAMNARKAAA